MDENESFPVPCMILEEQNVESEVPPTSNTLQASQSGIIIFLVVAVGIGGK